MLTQVGQALQRAVRPVDIVGRTGGDEFLIVCPATETVDGANAFAERIGRALRVAVTIDWMAGAVGAGRRPFR